MEYDALPDLGHARGHNLIAAAGLGAALAIARAMTGLDGTALAVGAQPRSAVGARSSKSNTGCSTASTRR